MRRSTIRFSFSDWLPGTCSSTVKRPTTIDPCKAGRRKGRKAGIQGRRQKAGIPGTKVEIAFTFLLDPSAFPPSALNSCLPAFCLPALPLRSNGNALHHEHLDHVTDLDVV